VVNVALDNHLRTETIREFAFHEWDNRNQELRKTRQCHRDELRNMVGRRLADESNGAVAIVGMLGDGRRGTKSSACKEFFFLL
jgi:hypothetical protein